MSATKPCLSLKQQAENHFTTDPVLNKAFSECALLNKLPADDICELLEQSKFIDIEEDGFLIRQGESVSDFYLLLKGELKLFCVAPSGQEKIMHIIHSGQPFAEALMFLEQPVCPVNAVALESSRVIAFPNHLYKSMLSDSVEACFGILAEYAIRIRHLINEIESLTLHNATFRVVRYLLEEVTSHRQDAVSVKLKVPKHVIASRVSITPETLSRIFSKLKQEGIITVSDKDVTLKKISWMRKFVSTS